MTDPAPAISPTRPWLPFRATRLAPSPTGALHLGHARTFLITWWLARRAAARLFLRIDDLDPQRNRPDTIHQAYDDLRWLGIEWDAWNGAPQNDPPAEKFHIRPADIADGVIVQSRRPDQYLLALETLWKRNAIYPCTCSRALIAAAVRNSASAPHPGDPGENVPYPGTCRNLYQAPDFSQASVPDVTRRVHNITGKNVCWRLRVPDAPIPFNDLFAGPQSFNVSADAGDFPLTRFANPDDAIIPPAYQLACVVDDHAMGIDCVIRGDDLLASTPRQILLYQALGLAAPHFAHVPLVLGPDGKRLAKRHGESRIAQFRAAGTLPERVVGWTAWRTAQIPTPRNATAREILPLFNPILTPRAPITLTPADLAWLTPRHRSLQGTAADPPPDPAAPLSSPSPGAAPPG